MRFVVSPFVPQALSSQIHCGDYGERQRKLLYIYTYCIHRIHMGFILLITVKGLHEYMCRVDFTVKLGTQLQKHSDLLSITLC